MAEDQGDGLWLTISELAARKGVAKPTISVKVSRLEALGQIQTRPGKGKTKLVNLAQYDAAVGETTDLARERGAQTKREQEPRQPETPSGNAGDPIYTREQARRMAYQADREKIALGESLEKLVPVDRVAEVTRRLFEPVLRRLDRLESRAGDAAAAVGRDGTNGARQFLKALKIEIRNDLADGFATIAAELAKEPRRPLTDFEPRLDNQQEEASAEAPPP